MRHPMQMLSNMRYHTSVIIALFGAAGTLGSSSRKLMKVGGTRCSPPCLLHNGSRPLVRLVGPAKAAFSLACWTSCGETRHCAPPLQLGAYADRVAEMEAVMADIRAGSGPGEQLHWSQ